MIVPLIPLFLAASINLTEIEIGGKDDWKYGPEAIYRVGFECEKCIWYEKGRPETAAPFNETLKLSCRPKSITTLSCQLYSEHEKKQSDSPNETEIFELHFSRSGLQKIVVSTSMDPFFLDTIRATVAQLNVAADVFTIGKNDFEISEKFFTGTCRTHYLLRSEINVTDNEPHIKSYKTFLVSDSPPRKGEIKKMRRNRNLEKCQKRLDYYFSNLEPMHTTPSTFETKLISSRSLMTNGESDFSSWTENTIVLKDKATSIEETLTERITLTLEDIVPATGPLMNLEGPTLSASIFLKNWVDDKDSEEDSSSGENEILESKTDLS